MNRVSSLQVLTAAVLGAMLAVSAYAGESTMKKGEPASVDESRQDLTGREPKGKAGVPTMPSKGPASVSESKTGQGSKGGPVQGASKDDSKMANPKTPSSVSESRPDQTVMEDKGKSGMKKRADKDKDAMTK